MLLVTLPRIVLEKMQNRVLTKGRMAILAAQFITVRREISFPRRKLAENLILPIR